MACLKYSIKWHKFGQTHLMFEFNVLLRHPYSTYLVSKRFQWIPTPPNKKHWKVTIVKGDFISQSSIFRRYVSFQSGIYYYYTPEHEHGIQALMVWIDVFPSLRGHFQVPAVSFGGLQYYSEQQLFQWSNTSQSQQLSDSQKLSCTIWSTKYWGRIWNLESPPTTRTRTRTTTTTIRPP